MKKAKPKISKDKYSDMEKKKGKTCKKKSK